MPSPQLDTPTKVTSFWVPATIRDHLNTTAARRDMAADALVNQLLAWGLAGTPTYELSSPARECRAGYRLSPELRQQLVDAALRHGSVKKQSALFVAIVQAWFARHEPDVNLDSVPTDEALHTAQHVWQQPGMRARVEDHNESGTQLPATRSKLMQPEASMVDIPFDTDPDTIEKPPPGVLDDFELTIEPDEELGLVAPMGSGPSITTASIRQYLDMAIETVVEACYGDDPDIQLVYNLFHVINARWFADTLPLPFTIRGLTPYSHGFSWLQTQGDAPLLFIHPRLFATTLSDRQNHQKAVKLWGVPPAWFGSHLLGDVILHECLHAHLVYNKGGTAGPTSHNNRAWVAEVNRLLPLLGFRHLRAGRSKTVRVPVTGEEGAQQSKSDGRNAPSRVERRTDGNIPFKAVAMFPIGVRRWLQKLCETEALTPAERQILTANTALAAEHYYTQTGVPFGLEKKGN